MDTNTIRLLLGVALLLLIAIAFYRIQTGKFIWELFGIFKGEVESPHQSTKIVADDSKVEGIKNESQGATMDIDARNRSHVKNVSNSLKNN